MRERVITLLQVAQVLGLSQTNRPQLRRAAIRAVRKLETQHRRKYLIKRGKEFVVSIRALEELQDDNDLTLTGLERTVSDIAQNQRHMRRELKAHGSRISNLEQWRRITQQYVDACARLIES